jgi:hypothetical protein
MKILENAQIKVDTSANAPIYIQESARKYKEMQEDLLKPPQDRKHGGFQEGYELLSMSDVDRLTDTDESGADDSTKEKAESKPAARKRGRASNANGDDIEAALETQTKNKRKKTPPVAVCEMAGEDDEAEHMRRGKRNELRPT